MSFNEIFINEIFIYIDNYKISDSKIINKEF